MRLPREATNVAAAAFKGLSVSKAMGRKSCDTAVAEYFATFNSAALSAALSAEKDERCLYYYY